MCAHIEQIKTYTPVSCATHVSKHTDACVVSKITHRAADIRALVFKLYEIMIAPENHPRSRKPFFVCLAFLVNAIDIFCHGVDLVLCILYPRLQPLICVLEFRALFLRFAQHRCDPT